MSDERVNNLNFVNEELKGWKEWKAWKKAMQAYYDEDDVPNITSDDWQHHRYIEPNWLDLWRGTLGSTLRTAARRNAEYWKLYDKRMADWDEDRSLGRSGGQPHAEPSQEEHSAGMRANEAETELKPEIRKSFFNVKHFQSIQQAIDKRYNDTAKLSPFFNDQDRGDQHYEMKMLRFVFRQVRPDELEFRPASELPSLEEVKEGRQ
jgi:hypothetical protein